MPISKYRAKTIYHGYKINLVGDDRERLIVGVPEKRLKHTCMVKYDTSYMVVEKGTKPLARYFQEGKKDKDGNSIPGFPDFYLCYFFWKPYQKKAKREEIRALEGLANGLRKDQIQELIELGRKFKTNRT